MTLSLPRALVRTLIWLLPALLVALLLFPGKEAEEHGDEPFSLNSLLGSEQSLSGFERARAPAQLRFPEDHSAHPGFQNEWWYLTGQLQDKEDPKRRFGIQFTLFRFALVAPDGSLADAETGRESGINNPWLAPQFYMGHLAITSTEASEHRASERFSRQGPGLAGAGPVGDSGDGRLRVWLADWSMQALSEGALFPMKLQAADPEMGIALQLSGRALKPRVLQGDRGFSLKNRDGGASYYYSYPRLALEGSLQWDQQSWQVDGEGWFDHEWSSNSLAPWQAGWDWFSLQLEDNRELMFYRFRNQDGSEGLSHLALIDAGGQIQHLGRDAVELSVLDWWQSNEGVRYPSGWRLRIAGQQLDLRITPLLRDQLMELSVRYWEGAVEVSGSHRGRGYVELAGYR